MGFRWHPAARLMNVAQTREIVRYRPVIPDQPAWRALTAALVGQGAPFRIGGTGPAPEPGPEPVFETLTGGSTGTPRRIRRTQSSWTASFAVNATLFAITPGTQSAVLGDLVHSLALPDPHATLRRRLARRGGRRSTDDGFAFAIPAHQTNIAIENEYSARLCCLLLEHRLSLNTARWMELAQTRFTGHKLLVAIGGLHHST